MADAKLSVNEIMLLIVGNPVWCNIRTDIVVPNLSWGLLNHEADLAIIRKSGYLTEIEIKRSYQDLKKDFDKNVFHKDDKVSDFYFCLPSSIKEKANQLFLEQVDKLKELYWGWDDWEDKRYFPAVIWYDDDGNLEYNKGWKYVGGRKLFMEEINKLTRLMSIRYWNLLSKTTNGTIIKKI